MKAENRSPDSFLRISTIGKEVAEDKVNQSSFVSSQKSSSKKDKSTRTNNSVEIDLEKIMKFEAMQNDLTGSLDSFEFDKTLQLAEQYWSLVKETNVSA